MDDLRWILLVVGLLILGGIYLFANPNRRPSSDDSDAASEDDISPSTPLDSDIPDEAMERELERLGELISRERHAPGDPSSPESADNPVVSSEPEKVVALFLRPSGNHRLPGSEILEAAEKVGLTYGDMQIFHRLQEVNGHNVAIFSLADMLSPGSFDIGTMGATSTPGLCLFLTLPNPLSALDAWDAMLATGQRLASILEIELLDEAQSSLSRQCIAHIREEMREYDRRYEYQLPR